MHEFNVRVSMLRDGMPIQNTLYFSILICRSTVKSIYFYYINKIYFLWNMTQLLIPKTKVLKQTYRKRMLKT